MPKAPPEAHALVSTEHDLAAHLAHRKVQKSIVARLAGQTGAAAHHFWRARKVGIRPLRVPAERAQKCLGLCGGEGPLWWKRTGMLVNIDCLELGEMPVASEMVTV